jgi:hypothetical protein
LRYAHQRYTESHLYGAPESDEPQPWTEVSLPDEPQSLELLPLSLEAVPPDPPQPEPAQAEQVEAEVPSEPARPDA